jgi:hypothetical protein
MAIKFQTHIPQTLYFPYGNFMEVSGQYGAQFLYTVESQGQRERLYATPRLHQDLQEAGVSSGDLATITKIEVEGNRMAWKVEVEGRGGEWRCARKERRRSGRYKAWRKRSCPAPGAARVCRDGADVAPLFALVVAGLAAPR